MINPNVDPVHDRDEFVSRLDKIFCPINKYSEKECLRALLFADSTKLDEIRQEKAVCDAEKERYLQAYDAAQTEEDKRQVVGSVKR